MPAWSLCYPCCPAPRRYVAVPHRDRNDDLFGKQNTPLGLRRAFEAHSPFERVNARSLRSRSNITIAPLRHVAVPHHDRNDDLFGKQNAPLEPRRAFEVHPPLERVNARSLRSRSNSASASRRQVAQPRNGLGRNARLTGTSSDPEESSKPLRRPNEPTLERRRIARIPVLRKGHGWHCIPSRAPQHR